MIRLNEENATAQPVSEGWVKSKFSYNVLFNAIAKSVTINSENSMSISVKAFEDAMLAAAPGGQDA